jgi:hypothetical protein
MMSSAVCYLQAEACELRGAESQEAALRAGWLEMARHWRDLGGDMDVQATTARLIDQGRIGS